MKNQDSKSNRVWVVTELFAPDDAATAHLLTQIAEHLATQQSVSVVCAQPTYTNRGQKAKSRETTNGVDIYRCWSTTFSKDSLPLRLVNIVTIMISFFCCMLLRFRRNDTVLVVTNPPTLPFATQLAAWLRGCKTCLLVHDIYPNVLVPTGFTKEKSIPYRIIDFFNRQLFRRVDHIITLGRDMKNLVEQKDESLSAKTSIVPNWADESLKPVCAEANKIRDELQFGGKFVIQYSGNIGRTHGLSVIARAAEILERKGVDDIHWMVCGWGGGKSKFQDLCESLELKTISIHEPYPRERLAELIGVADVSIISFIVGMAGISVPSRMYNVLACGCPIIGVTEEHSELALTISDDNLGWVVEPGNETALAELVESLLQQRSSLSDYQDRCQLVSQQKFARNISLQSYGEIISQIARSEN